jgi:hypothetical protein
MRWKLTGKLLLPLLLATTVHARIIGEHPVSDPIDTNAPGGKTPPITASDGDGFLVAWNDYRALYPALYVARVTASGEVLDPTGIRLGIGGYSQRIVFAGDSYSVFWMGDASGTTGATLYVLRLSRDGRVIDGPRVVDTFFPTTAMDVATNGRRIVVAWTDRLAILSTEGELLERDIILQTCGYTPPKCPPGTTCLPPPPPPPPPPCAAGAGHIASNGSGFLVALPTLPQNVTAIPLDGNGHPTSTGVVVDPSMRPAAIASDGNDYLVVDVDVHTNDAVADRISANGDLLDRHDLGGRIDTPDIALIWTGTNYVAMSRLNFGDAPQATLRLTRGGEPLARPPAGHAELAQGAIASNGRDVFAVWNGGTNTQASIFAERLDPATFATGAAILVSRSAAMQASPSIAFGGINYAVAWGEGGRAWLRLFSLNGDPLDPMPMPLDDGVPRQGAVPPRVTFDGRDYVAAAAVDNAAGVPALRIRITRIAVTGVGIGRIEVPAGYAYPLNPFDLRSDGANTVLAWASTDERLHAAHVTDSGLLDDHAVSPLDFYDANAPSLAWSGSEWLVAFQIVTHLSESDPSYRLYGARLSQSLEVLDPTPIELGSTAAAPQPYPPLLVHAASVGGDFMVAMTHFEKEQPSLRWKSSVQLRRVHADGSLDELRVVADSMALDIAADGSRYALAAFTPAAGGFQQYVAYLDRAGNVSPGDGFVLGFSVWIGMGAQLVAGDSGIVAAYQRTAYEPLYGGVDRVFLRGASPRGRGRATSSVMH